MLFLKLLIVKLFRGNTVADINKKSDSSNQFKFFPFIIKIVLSLLIYVRKSIGMNKSLYLQIYWNVAIFISFQLCTFAKQYTF